jgi:hypothetical protein
MPTPTTYPSAKQFLNAAKETTQGTAVTTGMTTMPVTEFKPKDDPVWLRDQALRGSMVETYGLIQGPQKSSYTMNGAVFLDWLPMHLLNLMGDITTTGAGPTYTHAISTLNSGTAQPPSDTFVDWQGLTATSNARTYPGCCHSELTLKGNPESSLIEWSAKGMGYWSSAFPTAPPTSSPSTDSPIAAWRVALGFGGPASGGTQSLVVREWEVTTTRKISVQHTSQNSQAPYIIQRGPVATTFKFFVAKPSDETFLNYMRNNTQPVFQLLVSNGLAAGAARSLQIDMQALGVDMTEINRSDLAVGYDVSGEAIANTTNAGASGGSSPVKYTVINATAAF